MSTGPPPTEAELAAARAADWEDQQRQDGLIITAVILTATALLFVSLRTVSRFILIRNAGKDDYLILGAMVFTLAYLADLIIGRANHMGFPITTLNLDNMLNIIKVTLSIEVMYYANIFCIKTSILFTYLRFAVSDTFRTLCTATVILHSVFFVICVVVTLAQCRPLEKMWDLLGTVEGSCINTTAFFYVTSSFNIITDIWILCLPIKTLSSVHRPRREKLLLFIVFGVGTFAAVASIVRLHTIYTYTEAADPFRESLKINLWSMIEVCIAISCASVSALKPIFSAGQRQRSRALHSSDGGPTPRRTGGAGGGGGANGWARHFRLSTTLKSSSTASRSMGTEIGSPDADTEMGHMTPDPAGPGAPERPRGVGGVPASSDSGALDPVSEEHVAAGTSAESASTEESMIVFTPLSPRERARGMDEKDLGGGGGGGGMSSSGSMLVLQK